MEHDKKWTGEALFNILDNAVKYTQAEGRVYISVCRQEIFTRISIKDTGKGNCGRKAGSCFQSFLPEPEIHDSEGIGIGLYLAARSSLCRTVILSWNPRQDKEVPSKFIFPIWIRKSHSFVIFSFCERFVIIMLYFYDIRIVRARSEQFCIIGL